MKHIRRQITHIALAIMGLGFVQVAQASDLEGTWRFVKQGCSSGAPMVLPEGIQAEVSGTVEFTATEMKMKLEMKTHYDQDYIRYLLKSVDETLKQIEQQPDHPQKQKSISQMKETREMILRYGAGVQCTHQEVRSYLASGSTIRSQSLTFQSDCPGAESDNSLDESTFHVKDRILKVSFNKPSDSCPQDGSVVTTFQRIK